MAVLTDLSSAEIKRSTKTLYGMTLTRPALLVSDGIVPVYAVDVHIGPTDPTGRINQYINDEKKKKDGTYESTLITGIPGQTPRDFQLDDTLPGHVDTTMHNVPLARNNQDLIYAEVGNAVVMNRDESGNWQVNGFAMERPGTHILYPVDLGDMTIGTVMDLSISTRLLTLMEMGTEAPWGNLPFGASAIFEGDNLIQIV